MAPPSSILENRARKQADDRRAMRMLFCDFAQEKSPGISAMKSFLSVALIASFSLSPAAFAAESGTKKDKKDPDRLICRSEEVLGSRLAKNKRCLTAAQWDEERRAQRTLIDRAQATNFKNN
jgi:hypothetical protein